MSRKSKDSKVGRKISETATKIVILIVFILIILLPLFLFDFWITTDVAGDVLCNQFKTLLKFNFTETADYSNLKYLATDSVYNHNSLKNMLAYTTRTYVEKFASISLGELRRIEFVNSNITYYDSPSFDDYRNGELIISTCSLAAGDRLLIYKQESSTMNLDAGLGILRTIYISLILIGGSFLFSHSANVLVIAPIERMIERVINMIENPQTIKEEAFINQEEMEFKKMLKEREQKEDNKEMEGEGPPQVTDELETLFLEKAINKIGVLLGVGLGDAGSELMNSFLNKETNILNIANQIDAAFCFCDIRNFTDATEILQEEVMVFVNTIADIVHSIADNALGSANKNVGDAFLLVWRINIEDAYQISSNEIEISNVWRNLTDLALFSVLDIHAEMGRSFALKKFVENEKLKARIGKGFKIRLGFGLHFGWAIEGALGSHFKVDATYLSPHVNMAARLEGDTKKYGIPILISGAFHSRMSKHCQDICRQIDSIETSEGGVLQLFTPLINDKYLKYSDTEPFDMHILRTKDRFNFKKFIRHEITSGKLVGKRLFQNDKDISMMLAYVHPQLGRLFKIGFDLFKTGEWESAKRFFDDVQKLDSLGDGPSKFLIDYMQGFEFKKPVNWKGSRNEH